MCANVDIEENDTGKILIFALFNENWFLQFYNMAKQAENIKNPKVAIPAAKKASTPGDVKDLFGKLNTYLDQRLSWIIWVIMGVTFVFSLLLFDSRVSLSGDDSFYIIRASDFIHSFKYPGFQGPLYPIVLSLWVAVFGISLVPLKFFSLLLIMGFMYLFFKAYRSRIPSLLLVAILSCMSVNSFILYYGSQTYNEAFYLFMQMLLILVFFRSFIDHESVVSAKDDIKRHLVLAIALLGLTLTKNMGYSAVIAVAGYFLLQQQWKNLLYSIAIFGIVMILFQGVKYALWHDGGIQFSSQGSGLMNKDYYNPQAGKEDLAGYFARLVDNSRLYLSKHFVSIIGLRKSEPMMGVSSTVTTLVYIFAIASLLLTFKKNRYIFFTGLMTGAFLLITFVVLQTKWDQGRLVIPAVPGLLLMIFSAFYYFSEQKKYRMFQLAIPFLLLVVFFKSLAVAGVTAKENQSISGKYGGLTPDWKNYLKASEWAAVNLPKDAIIACRKPSISFVYGRGRNFYGIMQLPNYKTEVFFEAMKKEKSSYMVFNYNDFYGKQLSPQLYSMLKQNLDAMLFVGDTVLFADKINDAIRESFTSQVNAAGFRYISSADSLKSLIQPNQVVKLYYPDSLLYNLQNNGVTHIMTASLRRNSTRKDGMTINTVERYMAFIQEKYPEIFTKVSQVGDDENEPAVIYKIDYEKYGYKVKPPKTQ